MNDERGRNYLSNQKTAPDQRQKVFAYLGEAGFEHAFDYVFTENDRLFSMLAEYEASEKDKPGL